MWSSTRRSIGAGIRPHRGPDVPDPDDVDRLILLLRSARLVGSSAWRVNHGGRFAVHLVPLAASHGPPPFLGWNGSWKERRSCRK